MKTTILAVCLGLLAGGCAGSIPLPPPWMFMLEAPREALPDPRTAPEGGFERDFADAERRADGEGCTVFHKHPTRVQPYRG